MVALKELTEKQKVDKRENKDVAYKVPKKRVKEGKQKDEQEVVDQKEEEPDVEGGEEGEGGEEPKNEVAQRQKDDDQKGEEE
ncbi:hypothetical protein C0995_011727 [Termitomyces sp. Mi166|nr:hypothetical protein C0995_011727 [Termitomyces sp. Mi166\